MPPAILTLAVAPTSFDRRRRAVGLGRLWGEWALAFFARIRRSLEGRSEQAHLMPMGRQGARQAGRVLAAEKSRRQGVDDHGNAQRDAQRMWPMGKELRGARA